MKFLHRYGWRFSNVLIIFLFISALPSLAADKLDHVTQSDFAPGSFFQTVLGGTEENPEIGLGSYTFFSWNFDDDDIEGWTYDFNESGSIAEESPSGQIHLLAQFGSLPSGSWAYAERSDAAIPDVCSIEFLICFDAIDSSGVADPLVEQPTGASCRLDILRNDLGFRMDIFRDRMASFHREGTTGADYPVNAYVDVTTNLGQWYTIRLDCDFTEPGLPVQVYQDDVWVGELYADTRNTVVEAKIRPLAYSRVSDSGTAECHVDRVRVGFIDTALYSTGTYTSEMLDLNAGSFSTFTWGEVPSSPYLWESWTKYAGNPITGPGSLPENMLVNIEDPLQRPLQYDGRYWLCYSSGGPGQSICLAYTTDPELFNWTDYESNPVISYEAGEDYVFSPNIFLLGDVYYMVFDVQLSADHHQRIAYATAPAPTGPWTRGSIILDLGAPGEWDDLRVTEPFVVKDGDTYFMYYMGDHGCSGCAEQIGLATTPDSLFPLGPEPGGLWTKHGLVLPHDPDPEGWDRGLTADPSVIKLGHTFFMRYTGSYANEHWELGCAWATNPYGPWHRPDSPEIYRGPPGSWDDDKLVRGAIHYHNGKWYSPYTGSSESGNWLNYQGGMATANIRYVGSALLVETRTSANGSVWSKWLALSNGGLVQSPPGRYFQYRVSFSLNEHDTAPTLTSAHLGYTSGTTTGSEEIPLVVRMHRPYPNPFNPQTVIGFTLDRRMPVNLTVYDVMGASVSCIADRIFDAGHHEVAWDGRNSEGRAVSSGVYFLRMEANDYSAVRRAVLLR